MKLPLDMIELGQEVHELLTAASSESRRHYRGATLWGTTGPVDRVLLVQSGVVARFKTGPQGRCVLALRYAGEVFYPHESIAPSGLATLGFSETLEADGAVFRDALRQRQRLSDLYQRSLQRNERIAYEWLFRSQLGAREAVAHFLCEHADRSGAEGEKQLVLPLFQKQISELLGISLMQVNRSFKSLGQDGLLTQVDIRTFLVDWGGLRGVGEYSGDYLR